MALKLLSLTDIKQSITMAEAIKAMERSFVQLAEQKAVLPLRTGVPVQGKGLTLTMPAYLAQEQALGLKVVSVFPDNVYHNKQAINGVILLLDAITGEPLVLMEAGYLTALRTGAVSGLATQYFARDDASTVAIIGSGVQAMTQLEAVAAVRDIKRVMVWSRNLDNARKFAQQFETQYDIQACAHLSSALKQADIICTATGSTEPLISYQDLKPHAHINAIGSHSPAMQEINAETLQKAVVIVDQKEAALAEAGEIISAINKGMLAPNSLLEIGSWLLNKTPNYKDELTVFKSVGLATQDLSVAQAVYQNALKKNLGSTFALNN